MMKKIIFNADDFGYCKSVNYAILDSFNSGLLKSTTLMANMSGFDQAVVIAKDNPSLGVGVHLTLTCGAPLTKTNTLINEKTGQFKKISFYSNRDFNVDSTDVYQELKAQIERIINAGIKPTHFDSHQHVHTMGEIADVVKRLSDEYGVPIRNNGSISNSYFATTGFTIIMDDYSMKITPDTYERLRNKFIDELIIECQKYSSIEVMTHPGYLDYSIFKNSSFTIPRAIDAALLQDPIVIEKIKKTGFDITNFQETKRA